MGRPIDILGHLFTPDSLRKHFLEDEEESKVFDNVGRLRDLKGYTPKEFLAYADNAGLGKVHVAAFYGWSFRRQKPMLHVTPEEVHEVARQLPGRVYGLYGVNPFEGLAGVRRLEKSVKEYSFVGIHVHPHGFDLGPEHAFYFPYYAKCVELGVPAVFSMGHTLDFMPIDNGRPARLDRIALYFPELTIVCTHTGWPWVEEAIAIASKHPNVYLGTSAYAPKYWKPEMVKFINSWGQDKVLWGSDFPLIKHPEALKQVEELGLREGAKEKLLWKNAEKVFPYDR
ncbi:antibiotic resistance protein [Hypericibacter adhaerens]|uniref:Antibiotic resistance protein n=1 Tax=Hypericibacter adhaerens TaxID=2602016 RepID=A0A5J6MSV9_9PROT|nr:amidohydrolase family protein [Hypericibacter adhaerens]QEX20207.1 antibiotic resistance protein [Hypericibacter adhaerens]